MRKLTVFNHVTLDGYFVGENGDFSWARAGNDDPEYSAFVADNAKGDSQMVFGRVTYQMMASYWPTAMADQHDPVVAKRMNAAQKIVFSKTLDEASWNNTTVLKGDLVTEIKRLKSEDGPDMVAFGSGKLIASLAQERLVDAYQFVIDPVVLGKGRTMFDGIREAQTLKLTKSRIFNNGKLFLSYTPV